MIIRRIEPMSAAKVGGALYAMLGLLVGCLFTLVSFTGFAASASMGSMGALFGVGAIIILPIVYGIMGFIVMGISAFVYNIAAKMAGGIELQVEP
jgi:hypothetical protein